MTNDPGNPRKKDKERPRRALVVITLLAFWGISTAVAVFFLDGATLIPGGDPGHHLARALDRGRVFLTYVRQGQWGRAYVAFGGAEAQYPGFVYGTLDVAFLTLGTSYRTIALHNALWTGLVMAGLYLLARRFLPAPGAVFCACLASLFPFMAGGGRSIVLDFNLACLYPWVVLAFLRTNGFQARRASFLAGFVAGISFFTRAHAAFYFWPLPILVALRSLRRGSSIRALLIGCILCGLGFLAAIHPYLLRFTVFRWPGDRSIAEVTDDLVIGLYEDPQHAFASHFISPFSLRTSLYLLKGLAAGLNPLGLGLVLSASLFHVVRFRRLARDQRLVLMLFLLSLATYSFVPIKIYDYYIEMSGPAALLAGGLLWAVPRRLPRLASAGAALVFCCLWATAGTFFFEQTLFRLPLLYEVQWAYFLPGRNAYRFQRPGRILLTSIVRELRERMPPGDCTYTFLELREAEKKDESFAWPLMQAVNSFEMMEGGITKGCDQARKFPTPEMKLEKYGMVHERTLPRFILNEPLILVARETKMAWNGDSVWLQLGERYDLVRRFRVPSPGIALLDIWVWRSKSLGSAPPAAGP